MHCAGTSMKTVILSELLFGEGGLRAKRMPRKKFAISLSNSGFLKIKKLNMWAERRVLNGLNLAENLGIFLDDFTGAVS